MAEESLQELEVENQKKWLKNRNEGKHHQQLKAKGKLDKGKQGQTSNFPRAMGCPKCGKKHGGECLAGQGVCYTCKQPGHSSPYCPLQKKKGVVIPGNQSSGRVFTLSGKKAKGKEGLIKGVGFLNQEPVTILFDSDATHSFISCECALRLQLILSSLPYSLVVSTPAEGNIETSIVCENCTLIIFDRVFLVHLICLPLQGLDVILGMDWLSANQVLLNCPEKSIIFLSSGEDSKEVSPSLFASVSQINQCLDSGEPVFICLLS